MTCSGGKKSCFISPIAGVGKDTDLWDNVTVETMCTQLNLDDPPTAVTILDESVVSPGASRIRRDDRLEWHSDKSRKEHLTSREDNTFKLGLVHVWCIDRGIPFSLDE